MYQEEWGGGGNMRFSSPSFKKIALRLLQKCKEIRGLGMLSRVLGYGGMGV